MLSAAAVLELSVCFILFHLPVSHNYFSAVVWLLKLICFVPDSVSQLVLFGLSNQMVVTFKEENTAAFKHLFLKGYQDKTPQAVHTQKELYNHIYFAIEQVAE